MSFSHIDLHAFHTFQCKNLAELLGGELTLDESFDSSIEGCPGARFLLTLKKTPAILHGMDIDHSEGIPTDEFPLEVPGAPVKKGMAAPPSPGTSTTTRSPELVKQVVGVPSIPSPTASDADNSNADKDEYKPPENISVLLVDDDMVLRRLISRSFKRVAPTWNIMQAANGETALRLVDDHTFDLIFIDQYMASVEKTLLGTETTRALRAKGVTARICGLSANNMQDLFLQAGANAFLQKPIPCQREQILDEIRRVLEA